MTDNEITLLWEYRYNKLCRLENNAVSSRNLLDRYMDNHGLISCHLYDVVYIECFRHVMAEIFELLKINEKGSNNNE